MEFSPEDIVVKRCIQGMGMEENGKSVEASKLFVQAWNESTHDFQKFIASHFIARHQKTVSDKLTWLETNLQLALKIDDASVRSALRPLYVNISKCYADLNDPAKAKQNAGLANSIDDTPADDGPFYHGTKAALQVGDLLTAGIDSNYKTDLKMNHVYFTALINGAGLAAALARGEGQERVYIVRPTGRFENDPNVTNKKFPGNPTRSYRSQAPLEIIGEVIDWKKITAAERQQWRERLANNKGEIIN